MGAFDKLAQLKEQPFAQNSQSFYIQSAEYQGLKPTRYGNEQSVANVVAGPSQGELDTYIVYGVMAEQVQRQDDGDFPRHCKIIKDGEANVIQPA